MVTFAIVPVAYLLSCKFASCQLSGFVSVIPYNSPGMTLSLLENRFDNYKDVLYRGENIENALAMVPTFDNYITFQGKHANANSNIKHTCMTIAECMQVLKRTLDNEKIKTL